MVEMDEFTKRRLEKIATFESIAEGYLEFFNSGNSRKLENALQNSKGLVTLPTSEPGAKRYHVLSRQLQGYLEDVSKMLISQIATNSDSELLPRSSEDSTFTYEVVRDLRKIEPSQNFVRCAQFTQTDSIPGVMGITDIEFSIRTGNRHDFMKKLGYFGFPGII
ncbi:MAG TPA: hypothetical protein VF189_04365 [Patescibacteria group bacterium]